MFLAKYYIAKNAEEILPPPPAPAPRNNGRAFPDVGRPDQAYMLLVVNVTVLSEDRVMNFAGLVEVD